ncbi:hypothetical protein ACHAW5_008900 [Stephanodiscus triporus]|uniref:PX domain-containing protein n=1 Tax=Stephanodiscus triporus TaxID=2934178 RepID=A0ABD3N5B4_9STRA
MMFLPEDKWSPRYESQFYTIRMNKHIVVRDPSDWPEGTSATRKYDDEDDAPWWSFCGIGRKKKYPAVYYEVEVLRGGDGRHARLRRYSQFDALCRHLDPGGISGLSKSLPPKTFTLDSWRSSDVIDERMVGLRNFLSDALARKECANDPVIMKFLGLDNDSEEEEEEEEPIPPPPPPDI